MVANILTLIVLKSKNHNSGYMLLLFGVIVGSIFVYASTHSDNSTFTFQLIPLDVSGLPNTAILCSVTMEVKQVDKNGNKIKTLTSNFFSDNPKTSFTFSIANKVLQTEVDNFDAYIALKCDSQGVIHIKPSEIEFRVFADNLNDDLLPRFDIYNAKMTSKSTSIGIHDNTWYESANFIIESSDLEKEYLPDGRYDAELEFTFDTEVIMSHPTYPQYPYSIEINHFDVYADDKFQVDKNFVAPPTCEITNSCLPPNAGEVLPCPDGLDYDQENNLCVDPTAEVVDGDNGESGGENVTIIDGFLNCLSSGSFNCYLQYWYVFAVGFVLLIIMIGVFYIANKPRPMRTY